MSFFGFDPSGPPDSGTSSQNPTDLYDFQETYQGLGEGYDREDVLDDDTFGSVNPMSHAAVSAPPQPSYHGAHPAPANSAPHQNFTYAQAAGNNDDDFMQELWGLNGAPRPAATEVSQPPPQHQADAHSDRKIMSLEEIEALLTSIDQAQRQQHPHPYPQQHPQQHLQYPPPQAYGMPGMMHPNQVPPHLQYGGYMMGPGAYGGSYLPFNGGQMPPMPPHIPAGAAPMPPHMAAHLAPQPELQLQVNPHIQSSATKAASPSPNHGEELATLEVSPAKAQILAHSPTKQANDMSQFPVLGAKNMPSAPIHGRRDQTPHHQGPPPHLARERLSQNELFQRSVAGNHGSQRDRNHDSERLSPEQQEKMMKRQEKLGRIMRYSGIMNPKDKDFVTRFQISQIVTEDPYNEDFYAQVFKVIHPKASSGLPQEEEQQPDWVARAYMELSGHRLGGRDKRADLALQRMQQQVQKAVAVAKDRPRLTQYAKEGALGKISLGGSKKPRQQLQIISKAAERELEKQEADKHENAIDDSEDGAAPSPSNFKKDRGVSISAPPRTSTSYTKRDVLSTLENIISELMSVESLSRTTSDLDTSKLWESLKVLELSSSSGDAEAEVNPFIQCLNYNKALKILPRLLKFLSREQVLTIAALIMSNLENLSVVKNGSYTTYENQKVPEKVLQLVEAYSQTFTKVLMNAVLEFKFNEILGLLVILIEHNNVSFVSTTKIGLTVLTTLLSRAELIIGEATISATDLLEWQSCYDELFTSIESRIAAIFPPHPEDVDDGSSSENYVWQFLATLSLGGKLSHQRIIVEEVRDEIFGVMARAKAIGNSDMSSLPKKQNLLNNLNMFLVVMGLVADENEIKELQG